MDIFNYHPKTGEYLGPSNAQSTAFEDGPILTSFSTPQEPPSCGANERAVFLGEDGKPPVLHAMGDWSVVADFRGTEYWLPDRSKHTITDLNEVTPIGALAVEPDPEPASPQERAKLAGDAVDQMLDALAISWAYRGYGRALGYVSSPVQKYAQEAQALLAYGSACFAVLDQIADGEAPEPEDIEALMLMMPPAPSRPVVGV